MERNSNLVVILSRLILAAFAVLPSPAAAEAGVWTSLGPDGGQVMALAVDPLDPDVVYAGTMGSGLFKSTDGGDTWAFAGRGLGTASVFAIAVDPVHRGTVYATTGDLLKSTDGGGTWVPIWDGERPDSPGDFTPIYTVVLDPRRPGTLYAGTGAGVYRSTNGGATWRHRGNLSGQVPALALDSAGGWLFAVHDGVFKSGDQGATWVAASQGIAASAVIESLAIDPDSPRTLLASTETGIYRTLDRGRSWYLAISSSILQRTAVAFQRRGRAYAIFTTSGQTGILRSVDAGATWQRSLIASPASSFWAIAAGPDVVYTGDVNDPVNRGLVRSLDGGVTWEPSMHGISGLGIRPVAVDPSDPRTLYAAGDGLFKSSDRGTTWTRLDLDLPPSPSAILDILIDPARPATIYAALNGAVGLLRSDDGGATWRRLSGGIAPPFLYDLALDPRAPEALWGTGSDALDSGLFHSGDGGETWERVEGLPVNGDFSAVHVEVDPRDPRVVYLGAAQDFGDPPQTAPRLFRSSDGGETWERRDAGLTGGAVTDIALDTADPSTLYATTTSRVYRSTDAGASWTLLPARGRLFLSIATAPAGPGRPAVLYAARWDVVTPTAVMCSTDRGETWTALRRGLDTYFPVVVEVDPTDPRRLYLSTVQRGLMTYTRE